MTLVEAYLHRLALEDRGPPTAEGLRRLHRAHVERIPYEAIEIQLGRPTTVDPHESAARIVERHRGGYCFHLNGAFSLLLEALGYDVVWHRGGVQNHSDPEPVGATGNHPALTVHGLPDDANPEGDWLVDAGLGDALHEPLPLRAGTYRQGPFTYALEPSTAEPGGWRFEHDPRGASPGWTSGPAGDHRGLRGQALLALHLAGVRLRADVLGPARDATGVDMLRGCVLSRVDGSPPAPRTLDAQGEWYAALRDVFDLPLTDLTAAERAALWARVRTAHARWLAGAQATTGASTGSTRTGSASTTTGSGANR